MRPFLQGLEDIGVLQDFLYMEDLDRFNAVLQSLGWTLSDLGSGKVTEEMMLRHKTLGSIAQKILDARGQYWLYLSDPS